VHRPPGIRHVQDFTGDLDILVYDLPETMPLDALGVHKVATWQKLYAAGMASDYRITITNTVIPYKKQHIQEQARVILIIKNVKGSTTEFVVTTNVVVNTPNKKLCIVSGTKEVRFTMDTLKNIVLPEGDIAFSWFGTNREISVTFDGGVLIPCCAALWNRYKFHVSAETIRKIMV